VLQTIPCLCPCYSVFALTFFVTFAGTRDRLFCHCACLYRPNQISRERGGGRRRLYALFSLEIGHCTVSHDKACRARSGQPNSSITSQSSIEQGSVNFERVSCMCSGGRRSDGSRDSGSLRGERHWTEGNRHSTAVHQALCRGRTRNTSHRT